MSKDKKRLEAVARVIYMGIPGVGGSAYAFLLHNAAHRLDSYAMPDGGDAAAVRELREFCTALGEWRDKLIAAVCDGPPIECACCGRPIPSCARCREAM